MHKIHEGQPKRVQKGGSMRVPGEVPCNGKGFQKWLRKSKESAQNYSHVWTRLGLIGTISLQ